MRANAPGIASGIRRSVQRPPPPTIQRMHTFIDSSSARIVRYPRKPDKRRTRAEAHAIRRLTGESAAAFAERQRERREGCRHALSVAMTAMPERFQRRIRGGTATLMRTFKVGAVEGKTARASGGRRNHGGGRRPWFSPARTSLDNPLSNNATYASAPRPPVVLLPVTLTCSCDPAGVAVTRNSARGAFAPAAGRDLRSAPVFRHCWELATVNQHLGV